MKKNLLTLMFVMAFVCVGVSVASAKTPISSENSVNVSKKIMMAKNISNNIKALKAKCGANDPCGEKLQALVDANADYEMACAPDYSQHCGEGGF